MATDTAKKHGGAAGSPDSAGTPNAGSATTNPSLPFGSDGGYAVPSTTEVAWGKLADPKA